MSTTTRSSIETDLLVPADRVSVGHTRSKSRVMGQVRNSRLESPTVRVALGRRVLFEEPVLLADLRHEGGAWTGTFDLYVDLPPLLTAHRLRVEVDDGTSTAHADRRLGRRTAPSSPRSGPTCWRGRSWPGSSAAARAPGGARASVTAS